MATSPADRPPDEILARELERRIDLIEGAGDDEFGRFTAFDWWLCIAAFFALPLLIAWLAVPA